MDGNATGISGSTVVSKQGPQPNRGLTLVELLAVIAVVTLLLIVGMPGFGANKDKRHLKGVAEVIQQDLRLARTEAIKRNKKVYIAFQGNGDNWCYGMNVGATCDCTSANSCTVDDIERVRSSTELGAGRVSLLSTTFSSSDASFNPVHGTVDGGSVKLRSNAGVDVKVVLSSLGRVRICSPDNPNTYGFSTASCSW